MSYISGVTTENLDESILKNAKTVEVSCAQCGHSLINKDINFEFLFLNSIEKLDCNCNHRLMLWGVSNSAGYLKEYRLCDYSGSSTYPTETQEQRWEALNKYNVGWIKYRSNDVFVTEWGEIILAGYEVNTWHTASTTKPLLTLAFDRETSELLANYCKDYTSKQK